MKVTGLCYFRLAALMSLGFSAGAVGLAAYYYFYQTQQQVGERLLEVQLPMVPPVRLLVGRSVCHNFHYKRAGSYTPRLLLLHLFTWCLINLFRQARKEYKLCILDRF